MLNPTTSLQSRAPQAERASDPIMNVTRSGRNCPVTQQVARQTARRNSASAPRTQPRQLLQEFSRLAALCKTEFRESIQPGGKLELKFQLAIEQLETPDECHEAAGLLAEQVRSAAAKEWKHVTEVFADRCRMSLAAAGVTLRRPGSGLKGDHGLQLRSKGRVESRILLARTARSLLGEASMAATVGGVIGTLVLPGLGTWLGAAAGGLLQANESWQETNAQTVRAARSELLRDLGSLFHQVRQHYLHVDATSGRFGRLDRFFQSWEKPLAEAIAGCSQDQIAAAADVLVATMTPSRKNKSNNGRKSRLKKEKKKGARGA